MIYLDHAAATPIDDDVHKAVTLYSKELFYNPSATYLEAKRSKVALGEARGSIAQWLGAKPNEIVFTAGGSEANNLAIQGVLRRFPNCSVAISGIEHASVTDTAKQFNCSVALTTGQGRVDLGDLWRQIKDDTVLVSVMYANNEVGTVQPLRQISQIVAEVRRDRQKKGNQTPIYFHTDACQAANYLDLHVNKLGVDLMTLNGSKIYGPRRSGALYISSRVEISPLVYGGGQERGLRSGTEDVASSFGLALALDIAQGARREETKRLGDLRSQLMRRLQQEIDGLEINGDTSRRLPNNVHFMIPGTDNERLLIELEQFGILAAAGSACSASNEEPSHVLSAMGLSEEAARSSVRITMGRSTAQGDIDQLVDTLKNILKNKVV